MVGQAKRERAAPAEQRKEKAEEERIFRKLTTSQNISFGEQAVDRPGGRQLSAAVGGGRA